MNTDLRPQLILLMGTDGAGKSYFATWLARRMQQSGIDATIVWSRFNNYVSKPYLAVTRLTGHNRYERIDGARFGFHDFEKTAAGFDICLRCCSALM